MDRDLRAQLARLRRRSFELLEEARDAFEEAMQPQRPNTFEWRGQTFWVDRPRHLILSIWSVGLPVRESLLEAGRDDSLRRSDPDALETLEVHGGERQLESANAFFHVLTSLIREGSVKELTVAYNPARLLNLVIAQPSINPAFASLFWLAFAEDVGPHDDPSDNFFDLIETMIYAQLHYPAHVPATAEVRRAQIAFLERICPGSTDARCEALSERAWAARCEAQLQAHLDFVDQRVFYALWTRTGAPAQVCATPRETRGDVARLSAWTLEAYQQGASVHDVVTAAFGTDLPREAYVFYKSRPRDPELPVELLFLPWRLLELAKPKHGDDEPTPWQAEQEANALAQDPDFLPLMKLEAYEARHDGWIIGYSLSALRQGKTTILGHDEDIPRSGGTFQVIGESLLAVLHEWAVDHLRMTEARLNSPANRGAGSLGPEDVERAADTLGAIEQLQRKLES